MRVGHVSPTRPNYFDRNPSGTTQESIVAAAAPHALVARFTYTVATGSKLNVSAGLIEIVRVTAAAPVGRATAQLIVTPFGVGGVRALVARLYTNVVNDRATDKLPTQLQLNAGDSISFQTEDLSTGGTVDYYGALVNWTFNA